MVASVACVGLAHARIDGEARVDRGEQFLPRPDHARLASLGFDVLLADYYWLQAVQVVGSRERVAQRTLLLASLVQLVTALDPWVDHPYRFAALWLVDSEASVRRANDILERGIAYHPRDWRNRYHLGFNHFFYLEEDARAAEVLETALPLEGAPRYLGALVARLKSGSGRLETASAFLLELVRTESDEYTKAEYLKALDEIETERAARYLDAARAEYRRRNGHDLERVQDLLAGPRPVLRALPPAHPHFRDFAWELDERGRIVSSFYGSRYELHLQEIDRKRRSQWRRAHEEGES